MMTRLAEIGIILLVVVWSVGVAVSAEETVTTTPTVTSSDIVITDDVEAYFGPLGPDNPLYGLKLALENLDEAFTFNASEKVMKQMKHAEFRISEIKGLLLMNKTVEAERALDAYFEKMNLTEIDLSRIPVRTMGIANAYQQHVKHELVLWDLLQENPNSTKLWQAYNHTLELENRFMEKSTIRIEKRIGQLNRITAKVVKVSDRTEQSARVRGSITETTEATTPDHGKGSEKQVGKGQGAAPVTTQTTTPASDDSSGKGKGNGNNGKGPK
jgi:hypothetical protein